MKVLLIDGLNLAYRLHWIAPFLMTRKEEPTSVLHGVLTQVAILSRDYPEHALIFCWDKGVSWRKQIPAYQEMEYKANRKDSEERSLVRDQLPILRSMLRGLHIRQIGVENMEGDDVIAALATECTKVPHDVLIYSGDRDMFQLLDKKIEILRPLKGELIRINHENFHDEYKITPQRWAVVKAFAGDSSDHIKPVAKLGDVTALKMTLLGADPTIPFKRQPEEFKKKFAKYERYWDRFRSAFELVSLRDLEKHPMIPQAQAQELFSIARRVASNPCRPSMNECTREHKESVRRLLWRYELNSVTENFDLLWRSP